MHYRLILLWILGVATVVGPVMSGCATSRQADDRTSFSALVAHAGELPPASDLARGLEEALETAAVDSTAVVSPRLLDRYITQAFPAEVDSSLVWRSYRDLLGSAAAYTRDTMRAHLEQHLLLSELLYPEAAPREADLKARAAYALNWWMEQETAPASGVHERLVTHLGRVAEARDKYPSATRSSGLDARGETFVRYGKPSRTRTVNFNEAELLQAFLRDGLPIRTRDFPENEIWLYDHLGQMAMFLFVEGRRGEGYFLGSVNDLVPRQLRSRGVSGSARGDNYALAGLRTLRYVFSQLALFHPAYSSRFSRVDAYVNWQEERAIAQRLGAQPQTAVAGYDAVSQTFGAALSRNERDDSTIDSRRAAALPEEYAEIDRPRVDLQLRTMRVLGPDGATSVNAFWKLDSEDFRQCIMETGTAVDEGRARLIAYDPGYGSAETIFDAVTATPEGEAIERHRFALTAPLEALALQVDAYRDGYVGACTGVARTRALEPLVLRGAAFEISDLLPFRVADVVETRQQLSTGFSVDDLQPHFPQHLTGKDAIGIYFEVYAATDLDDDYVIEYQVSTHTRGGILQRGRTRTSLYHASRAMVGTRLPAAFLIDASEWRDAIRIDVAVTVTHLETGADVHREMSFRTDG